MLCASDGSSVPASEAARKRFDAVTPPGGNTPFAAPILRAIVRFFETGMLVAESCRQLGEIGAAAADLGDDALINAVADEFHENIVGKTPEQLRAWIRA